MLKNVSWCSDSSEWMVVLSTQQQSWQILVHHKRDACGGDNPVLLLRCVYWLLHGTRKERRDIMDVSVYVA
jgi:hypothetical protein